MLPFGMLATFAVGTVLQFASLATADGVTFPATVELDLIFPRNGTTYAPGPKFPIVFAIQNAPAAASLDFEIDIVLHNSSRGLTHLEPVGTFEASNNSAAFASGASKTFYFHYVTDKLQGEVPTDWTVGWTVLTTNCSGSGADAGAANISIASFSTKPGAQAADLVASAAADAASNSSCQASIDSSITFGITGVQNITVQDHKHGKKHNDTRAPTTCAALSNVQPPSNPCAARLDPATASSIATAVNSSSSSNSSTAAQPKKNGGASIFGRQSSIWESAALLAVVGWIVCL
ncbi:hypothetical protein SBRCBS47491_005971 [Sporothrix bragantina]|uniref:DUF7136 domain-containing protein n=1 Tax=Sporothrix bragantina TaxID=671064 RepID=A0ABP0C149_9PEZI